MHCTKTEAPPAVTASVSDQAEELLVFAASLPLDDFTPSPEKWQQLTDLGNLTTALNEDFENLKARIIELKCKEYREHIQITEDEMANLWEKCGWAVPSLLISIATDTALRFNERMTALSYLVEIAKSSPVTVLPLAPQLYELCDVNSELGNKPTTCLGLLGDSILPYLRLGLTHHDSAIRAEFLTLVAPHAHNHPEFVTAILEAAHDQSHPWIVNTVVRAIGIAMIDTPESREIILKDLNIFSISALKKLAAHAPDLQEIVRERLIAMEHENALQAINRPGPIVDWAGGELELWNRLFPKNGTGHE